jgi:hypothetical protein
MPGEPMLPFVQHLQLPPPVGIVRVGNVVTDRSLRTIRDQMCMPPDEAPPACTSVELDERVVIQDQIVLGGTAAERPLPVRLCVISLADAAR